MEGRGDFMSDGMRVIYAGGNENQRGVAVILDGETVKRVTKIVQHSHRLILFENSSRTSGFSCHTDIHADK